MSTTINHDQFILGQYRTAVLKIAATAAKISARTILGKLTNDGAVTVTRTAVSAPAGAGTGGANTGTGTLVLDATSPVAANAEAGIYLVKCKSVATTEPIAEAVFDVFSPDGGWMGSINAGTDGADVWNNRIKFTITDKATAGEEVAFVVGDAFAITVSIVSSQADASGELTVWNPTATDGSEVAYAILAEEAPISVVAQYRSVYISGRFNADEALAPEGVDVDDAFDALRERGIILEHQADTNRNTAV